MCYDTVVPCVCVCVCAQVKGEPEAGWMVLESDIDDEGTHISLTLSKVILFALHCFVEECLCAGGL